MQFLLVFHFCGWRFCWRSSAPSAHALCGLDAKVLARMVLKEGPEERIRSERRNMVQSSLSGVAVLVLLSGTATAQSQPIDTVHSVITVRVFKSGLFSAFADNHEIRAPIASGLLDQAGQRVEVVVDSRKLVVVDPNLPSEKRQQVQERMLGPEVLDSNQFPEIRFDARTVKQEAADRFLVAGTLALHGKTRPISLHVVRSNGHYRGDTALKQRDFGMTPVSVAGGAVKVKDELEIEFDVVAGSTSYQAETER